MDIYFEEKYGKLDEFIEDGKSQLFEYEDVNGAVRNLFMLREIPQLIDGQKYFDIRTPYGYGGPLVTRVDGDRELLVKNYMDSFKSYCLEHNIVSEFIRFHPVIDNASDFLDVMNIEGNRNTVCTYFRDGEDVFMDEFHKSARKKCRKILRDGVRYEVIEHPANLDTFIKIYYDTMDRNEAGDSYYFKPEYFSYMLENFSDNLINVNVYSPDDVCIASGIYFVYGKNMHAHLSGTLHEYLYLSPAYILKYATAEYGMTHGLDYIHYGGGTSSSDDDSLLRFKMKFTKSDLCTFKVGKNIYNTDIYDKLVEVADPKNDYFPLYRG